VQKGNVRMTEPFDPKTTEKTPVRCAECDRMMEHYNTFVSPTNEETNVCWECLQREEKGFNTKRNFHRSSRLRGSLS